MINVAISAGVSVLKTLMCGVTNNPECPTCNKLVTKICKNLPQSCHLSTMLVCGISGKLMDDPLMIPNGRIYSEEALKDMALKNKGMVICPVTKETFPLKDVRKVYLV